MNRFYVVRINAWTPTRADMTPPLRYAVADHWDANRIVTEGYNNKPQADTAADAMNAECLAADYTAHYDGSSGEHVCDIPTDAIEDCTRPATAADEAVAHWLPFVVWHADRAALNSICRESGGWSKDEIEAEDEDTIRARVLWMACHDIKDNRAEDEDSDDGD